MHPGLCSIEFIKQMLSPSVFKLLRQEIQLLNRHIFRCQSLPLAHANKASQAAQPHKDVRSRGGQAGGGAGFTGMYLQGSAHVWSCWEKGRGTIRGASPDKWAEDILRRLFFWRVFQTKDGIFLFFSLYSSPVVPQAHLQNPVRSKWTSEEFPRCYRASTFAVPICVICQVQHTNFSGPSFVSFHYMGCETENTYRKSQLDQSRSRWRMLQALLLSLKKLMGQVLLQDIFSRHVEGKNVVGKTNTDLAMINGAWLSCHHVWWNNLLNGDQRAEDITYLDFSRVLDAIVPLCPCW